jgi:hypothetical protein
MVVFAIHFFIHLTTDFLLQSQVPILRHFHDAAGPRQALVDDRGSAVRRQLQKCADERHCCRRLRLSGWVRRVCAV